MSKNKMAFGILLLLLGLFSACGKSDSSLTADIRTPTVPNIINGPEIDYRESDIPVPDDIVPFAASFLQREIFLFDGQNISVIDQDGKELRRMVLSENEEFTAFDLQADKSVWSVSLDFGEKEAVIGRVPDAYHFVHFSQEGTILERVRADGSQFGEQEGFVYPYRLLVDGDYIYVMSVQSAYILDKSGMLVYELRASGENRKDQGIFKSLLRLEDGRVALASVVHGNESLNLIQIPQPENQDAEEISIALASIDSIFATGKQAALFLYTNNGFYDYELESGEQRLVFDNLKYGIDINNLAEIAVFSDDSIAIAERTSEQSIGRLIRYIPIIPAEDLTENLGDGQLTEDYTGTEKEVVVLWTINHNDTWLALAIADFNRSNKYYSIEMKDYYAENLQNIDEAEMRLNIDLATGKAPDIMVLPALTPSHNYISKGLLADLNEFMDNDPNFNRADYLPNLFEVLDLEGKIYEIFPLFWLDIILAKTADVGIKMGWTIDEFADYIDSKTDSQYIISQMTGGWFISWMIVRQFINPITGEPQFDRDDFKKLLAVAERFPTQRPQDTSFEFFEGLKHGNPLMFSDALVNFSQAKSYERFYFGEQVTIKGWPSSIGNGLQFWPSNYFSISAKAENPEGAWEFLKYILDNPQSNLYFPVKLSLLEEMAEKEYMEVNDPITTSFTPAGDRYYMKELGFSKTDIEKIMAAIKGVDLIRRSNLPISNIINEELGSYLNGQKSADEVADIIENRIGVYLAEQE